MLLIIFPALTSHPRTVTASQCFSQVGWGPGPALPQPSGRVTIRSQTQVSATGPLGDPCEPNAHPPPYELGQDLQPQLHTMFEKFLMSAGWFLSWTRICPVLLCHIQTHSFPNRRLQLPILWIKEAWIPCAHTAPAHSVLAASGSCRDRFTRGNPSKGSLGRSPEAAALSPP